MIRNQYRIIFYGAAASPLLGALEIYQKVRQVMPMIELRVCRTTTPPLPENENPQVIHSFRKMARDIERLMRQPGISEFAPEDLVEEMQQAAIWLYPAYPSRRDEVEADVALIAQEHGAIPVFSPVGKLATEVFAGIQIYGIQPLDRLVTCRFAYEVARLASDARAQDRIRIPMMARARGGSLANAAD